MSALKSCEQPRGAELFDPPEEIPEIDKPEIQPNKKKVPDSPPDPGPELDPPKPKEAERFDEPEIPPEPDDPELIQHASVP